MCVAGLTLLDSDNTVLGNLTHSVSKEFTNLRIVVGRDSGDLLYLVIVVADHLSIVLDVVHNLSDSLVDTALQVHWVCTGSHVLKAFVDYSLCQDCSCGSTITSIIAGLACNALHELCASVLELILKFHLFSHRNTILSNLWCAELLLNNDVASLRTECNLYCVSQLIDSVLKELAGICIEFNNLCHFILSLLFFLL